MAAHILIVDDNSELIDILRDGLERVGHSCECTGDGGTALRMLEQGAFDLVISDIVMPAPDGIELSRLFRKERPELPFIVISGSTNASYLDVARRLGARQVLAKPFTMDELLQAVDVALQAPQG
ncbi:MAG: response regulator [Planctomycetota bacterium]